MLTGKVALVTGASRGIGCAIAKKLAKMGALVIVNYNGSKEAAETVAGEICKAGGSAVTYRCDVSDEAATTAMITAITKDYGGIDILVNNAGITRDNLMLRMTDAEFDAVLATNLKGAFHTMRAAAKTMLKKRYGRIINIASVTGMTGNAGQANYAAAKAGLIGMTKTAARELASRGITVNAVAPGFIETDMTRKLPEEIKEKACGQIPLGRFGQPEDVANAVAFLAAEGAYLTGQVIAVDGGMVM